MHREYGRRGAYLRPRWGLGLPDEAAVSVVALSVVALSVVALSVRRGRG
jgi:hypothetical protein